MCNSAHSCGCMADGWDAMAAFWYIFARDFVETNLAAAAQKQKQRSDQHTKTPAFQAGDSVWLSIPTAGKLNRQWEWTIKSIQQLHKLQMAKVVHTNRLQRRNIPSTSTSQLPLTNTECPPPTIDHMSLPPVVPTASCPYPQRYHTPPDRFGC